MRGLSIVFFLCTFTGGTLSSPVTCSDYNTACDEVTEDLLDIMTRVQSVELCRQLCYDDSDCNYFTYYDANSSPLREACLTFRSCPSVHDCEDCVSESRNCETCGVGMSGIIDENLLDYRQDVQTERECKAACISVTGCSHYTYFTANHKEFPGLCFLLSSLIFPATDCESCLTGPVVCPEDYCLLDYMGNLTDSVTVTQSGTVKIVTSTVPEDCLLTILAVGGGGSGGVEHFLDYGGGGGSGYLDYFSGSVTKARLTVTVGQSDENTTVEAGRQGVVWALAGLAGEGWYGGDGYSGGGAACCGNTIHAGGTDGGDGEGESYNKGQGSHLDISTFSFQHFSLSPGAGGLHITGGGGGGVFINHLGPAWLQGQGEGYGGGGEGSTDGYNGKGHPGAPGVVIMEVRKKYTTLKPQIRHSLP